MKKLPLFEDFMPVGFAPSDSATFSLGGANNIETGYNMDAIVGPVEQCSNHVAEQANSYENNDNPKHTAEAYIKEAKKHINDKIDEACENYNSTNEAVINEAMTFQDLVDKYKDNPYGIGANSVEYVESENWGNQLVLRFEDSYDRKEAEADLKKMGIKAKKMSKSTANKAFKYRYELTVFESTLNEGTDIGSWNQGGVRGNENVLVTTFAGPKDIEDFGLGRRCMQINVGRSYVQLNPADIVELKELLKNYKV